MAQVNEASGSNASNVFNLPSHEENTKLGKEDFLKLLVTQLQNQNPLKPMKDREFIAQMSQFSTLEQMSNLNSMFTKFVNSQTGLASYSEMIGKEITWTDSETEATLTGIVDAVTVKDGSYYYVTDDQQVEVSTVQHVEAVDDSSSGDGEDSTS